MRFKVLAGKHVHSDGNTYTTKKGENIVHSNSDLVAKFPNKFRNLDDPKDKDDEQEPEAPRPPVRTRHSLPGKSAVVKAVEAPVDEDAGEQPEPPAPVETRRAVRGGPKKKW